MQSGIVRLERCGIRANAHLHGRKTGGGGAGPVWLVASRGRRGGSRVLWLIAVTARTREVAKSRAGMFVKRQGCVPTNIDAVWLMETAALEDAESDFAILHRRAATDGAAGIELAGAQTGAGSHR